MSTQHASPDTSASSDQPNSICISAMDKLGSWIPLPGEAVTLIVGLCGCTDADFEAAVLVMQKDLVVLSGGLHDKQVDPFKVAVAARSVSVQYFEFDGRSKNVVVPCPPPNVNLTDVELVVMTAAAQVPGADLSEVFAMGSAQPAREREKTPA